MSWTSLSNDDFTGYVLNMALVWKPYGDTERTISLQMCEDGPPQGFSEPPEPSPEAAAIGWAAFDELAGAGPDGLSLAGFCKILDKILRHPMIPITATLDIAIVQLAQVTMVMPMMMVAPEPGTVQREGLAKIDKMVVKVKSNLLSCFPIIYGTVFRLFDTNGNGTISKDEFVSIISIFKMPPSDGKIPKNLLEALFRALDTDDSGIIEPIEIADLLTDVINGICKLLVVVAETFEPEVGGPLKEAAFVHFDEGVTMLNMTLGMDASEPKVNIAKLVEKAVEMGPPDDFPISPSQLLDSMLPSDAAKDIFQIVLGLKTSFAEKFGEVDSLPKDAVVGIATEVIGGILDQFLNAEMVNTGLNAAGGISMIFPPARMVPPSQVSDAVSVSVGTARSFLKGGGMRRLLAAIISLFDANSDGTITKAELFGVIDNVQAFISASSFAEAKPILGTLANSILSMFDGDSDGVLDRGDADKIIVKLLEIAFSVIYLVIATIKQVGLAMALPAVNIGLSFKPMVIPGSSTDSITASDLECVRNL